MTGAVGARVTCRPIPSDEVVGPGRATASGEDRTQCGKTECGGTGTLPGTRTVRVTANRQLLRVPHAINDPAFAAEVVAAYHALSGRGRVQQRRGAR